MLADNYFRYPGANLTSRLACLLFTLLVTTQASAIETLANTTTDTAINAKIFLAEHQKRYTLSSKAYIVNDTENRWQPEKILSGEQDYRELLSQPFSRIKARGGTYWLALVVENNRPEEAWRLNFIHGRTDRIDAIALPISANSSSADQHLSTGMANSPASRILGGLGHHLPVELASGESTLLLIRTSSYHYLGGLYIYLEEASYSEHTSFTYQAIVLGLLGLMLGLSGYNLFIFLVTRDINYLWYGIFAISLVLVWSSYYGLLWSLFGVHDPQRYVAIYAQLSMLFFTMLFTRGFLDLRTHNRKLDYCFLTALSLIATAALAALLVHPAYIFKVYWGLMLAGSILTLSASISCITRGYRPARFLIAGQVVVALGIFETGLAYLGIYSYETPTPERFTAMGAIEMLLLSMALADRINQLRNEKRVAEEANELKTSFLAMMSHEIRTPLHGLLSMITLLSKTVLNKSQQQYVSSMDYSGKALLALLNGVLDYSKLEADHIEIETQPFDPRLLTESLVSLMSARASEKGLILSTHIDKNLPPQVVGDPNRIRQVLLNLIGNGIKFTDRGIVKVSVTETARNERQISLRFEVEDSGIGIAEQDQNKIFEVFTQADSSITRRFGGTGLGLTISKRLVAAMGGELQVDSRPGAGSSFFFTLSLNYTNKALPPQQRVDAASCPPLNILLVDDVELNRVAAAGLLEHEGHCITLAESAQEALELIDQQDFDLVLMDIHMPDMDGIAATRAIRSLDDIRKAGVPVIALTANASPEQNSDYLASGINAVACKPLEMEELMKTMARLQQTRLPADEVPA